MSKRWRNAGLYALLAVVLVAIITAFIPQRGQSNAPQPLHYSEFIDQVEANQVAKVAIASDQRSAQVMHTDNRRSLVNLAPDHNLLPLLSQHQVDIAVLPDSGPPAWQAALLSLAFPLLLLGGLFFLLRRMQSGGGNPAMSFGKSRARVQMEPKTQVTFGDVAGIEGAKLELTEVVDFLKNADLFTAVGAKVPKGVLLVGPPGTGKTLIAKAVAGEAGVPFFSISGSEFVEMFVGVGASRVRDLFKQAKKNAPCIVFIDEIDAVGRQRGAGLGGGNDEREQTLNQLLTEMDGFEGNTGIIIVAATNRPDVLDAALMRPGRFDRQVVVDRPDYKGRLQILKVHARGKTLSKGVDLSKIARRTPGYTGVDPANLLNAVALGGRVAEEIVYGDEEVNTGASNDLQQVTRVARQMVTRFGMSDRLGPVALRQDSSGMFLGRDMAGERDFSDDTAALIDEEVASLVDGAYRSAKEVLINNRTVLDELAQMLVAQETVHADELQNLLVARDVRAAAYL